MRICLFYFSTRAFNSRSKAHLQKNPWFVGEVLNQQARDEPKKEIGRLTFSNTEVDHYQNIASFQAQGS